MSQHDLFLNLLRPAVLHILRATGFHYGKPSAVDTVVDLTARYLALLAERTAYNAYSAHNDLTPDIADVRMAMQDCGLLVPTMTASEELWHEFLRKPLDDYNGESGARQMEEARRDAEDTADVVEFIEWVKGEQNREIRRIAGTYKPVATNPTEQLDQLEMDDYLSTLMKKHSKTGVESRFQGTALGVPADSKPVKIEGGGPDSIDEWCRKTRERAVKEWEKKALAPSESPQESSLQDAPQESPLQDTPQDSTLQDVPQESSLNDATQESPVSEMSQEPPQHDSASQTPPRQSAPPEDDDVVMETD